jgi:hypothetical protein
MKKLLLQFGYIYFNLVKFSDRSPLVSSCGEKHPGIENHGLKDTIHPPRKGGRLFLAAPVFPGCQRTATISRAQCPISKWGLQGFFGEKSRMGGETGTKDGGEPLRR